jgi:hypothetical protein
MVGAAMAIPPKLSRGLQMPTSRVKREREIDQRLFKEELYSFPFLCCSFAGKNSTVKMAGC